MNVVVLIKYVPDPDGTPELGPDHLLVRSGQGALDPGDEFGVEAALQLVERDGGEVTVVSMGPNEAVAGVQRALAMGAANGVLITDPYLRGADALATARVLATAIRRRPFDLVIAAVESTDGYTGTMPATMAELLDVPALTFARALDVRGGAARIERQTEEGYDVVECPLPAVITMTAGANDPRFPSLKGILQARQKPLERLSLTDLDVSADVVAPDQSVVEVGPAPAKVAGEVVGAGDDAVSKILDLLTEAKVV